MPRTRPKNSGGRTVVYIPFAARNSEEHIQSTSGGYVAGLGDVLARLRVEDDVSDQAIPTIRIPGWSKIQPGDILSNDSLNLATVLSGLQNQYDVLYIRGHCDTDSDYLESSDHTARVTVNELVAKLANHGMFDRLPRDFPGIIKVYGCSSAATDRWFFQDSTSFVQKFANRMWRVGYRRCSFYGYLEPLSTYVVDGHRRNGSHDKRASACRKQVFPVGS